MISLFPLTGASIYVLVIIGIAGLCAGSFINCAAWRMTHGESFVKGHSHCPSCDHQLGILDLIPVFSWLFLRGKCRYCGAKVSARYPLTELLCAVLFLSITFAFGFTLQALELCLLAAILLWLSLTDLDDYIIPNALIIAGIVLKGIFIVVGAFTGADVVQSIIDAVIGAVSVSIPLLILVLIADKVLEKETMGGGDIKLFFMVGMFFPWQQNILILLIACVFGILFGALGMVRRARAQIKAEAAGEEFDLEDVTAKTLIPFGPSIALATWVVMLCGSNVVGWYLGLF